MVYWVSVSWFRPHDTFHQNKTYCTCVVPHWNPLLFHLCTCSWWRLHVVVWTIAVRWLQLIQYVITNCMISSIHVLGMGKDCSYWPSILGMGRFKKWLLVQYCWGTSLQMSESDLCHSQYYMEVSKANVNERTWVMHCAHASWNSWALNSKMFTITRMQTHEYL